MEIKDVVERFKVYRPRYDTEVRELVASMGLKLRFIGEGAFRVVYRIVGLPLVVKIPKQMNDGIDHSKDEIKFANRIAKSTKYSPLRPFLPVFYYADKKTGIILMQEYKKLPRKGRDEVCALMEAFIKSVTGSTDRWGSDMHEGNIGIEVIEHGEGYSYWKESRYKIIDIGYL